MGAAVEVVATNTPLPAPQQNLTPIVTIPPTDTPLPTATFTPLPTDTPTPIPTDTPTPEPSPTPTPTPSYTFDLEVAEKHPTESLAPNVVRIYLYVYSNEAFALEGYSLRVTHNGAVLPVEQLSEGGLPDVTRADPGPYSRFTNLDVIFVEPQAGTWVVQLVDQAGTPLGPPATFELTADEETRELYVRYRQQ